ncbi:MAG: hypothetical protein ACRC6M_03445 [Microcystaceae cyanobacterium]
MLKQCLKSAIALNHLQKCDRAINISKLQTRSLLIICKNAIADKNNEISEKF